jgi:hypothetical protein
MLRVTLISVARVAAEQQAQVTIVQKTSSLWAPDLVAYAMRARDEVAQWAYDVFFCDRRNYLS